MKQCAEAGITSYIPKPLTSVNQKRGLFTKQDFVYDEAKDCYRCPQGEELTYRYESFELNRQDTLLRDQQMSGLSHQIEVHYQPTRAAYQSLGR